LKGQLLCEFANVFTLTLSEVQSVESVQHALNIPPNTQRPSRISQKPLTEPQLKWLYEVIDGMVAGGIIRKIPAEEAKWISAITLTPRDKGCPGMLTAKLRRKANAECTKAGLKPMWMNEEAGGAGDAEEDEQPREVKWRLCQNYIALNKVTPQHSFPMGNLESKQQRVVGHRWVSVIDFMAGYYVIAMKYEDVGYTAFEVPG
jgi:hypothetical protein